MVVISMIGILLFLGLEMLGDYYYDNTRSLGTAVQSGDIKSSLSTVESDVTAAERFLTTNAVTDPAASTTWSYTGSSATNRVLILSAYATTTPAALDASGSRKLVYTGASCDQPVKNNLVYFVSGGSLYRRTIASTTTGCGGLAVGQKQSCGGTTTGTYCKSRDALMLTGVESFTVDYYSDSAATTAIANQYGSDMQATIENTDTKTIKMTVTTKQRINGVDSVMRTDIRTTRQN